MTDLEKRIYNKHLAVSRSSRNKPFKLKENFDGFEENSKYVSIKRLSIFFTKHPNVNIDVYFKAPYELYKDVDYFDLAYFASPRGIKSYTLYKDYLTQVSPDSQIEDVKESLMFISKFCIQNKIQLNDYPQYRDNSIEPAWVYHYKSNKINLYSLMEFSNILSYILEMPEGEREILLGRFGKNFIEYRNKYNTSKELKSFLQPAFTKIKFFIDKNLNSTNPTL